MSVGLGLGLLYLAREGISFAMLKQIPRVTPDSVEEDLEQPKLAGALRRPLRIASRFLSERPLRLPAATLSRTSVTIPEFLACR